MSTMKALQLELEQKINAMGFALVLDHWIDQGSDRTPSKCLLKLIRTIPHSRKVEVPVEFTQGSAFRTKERYATKSRPTAPKLLDVLHCILSDADSVRHGQSFEDWASDFGYDVDSIKAKQCYEACLASWHKLTKLGLDQEALNGLDGLFQDY